MAATIKKEFLFKEISSQSLSYYEVSDGRDIIAENQLCDSPDQCIDELTELFDSLDESSVVVKLYNKTKKERAKGGRDYVYRTYKIRLKDSSASAANGSLGLLERIYGLELKIQMQAKEKEVEDLKKRLEAVENGENPMVMKGLEMLAGFLGAKPVTGLAGHDDEPVTTTALSSAERVRAALVRFSKIEKDVPGVLEVLASFAESNPDKYRSFLPIIKSMV